jgi:hypothetical protein
MEDDPSLLRDASEAVRTLLGRKLTPAEYADLKRGLSDEAVLEALVYSERSYLVLGSYGTDERDGEELRRLTAVRDVIDDRHPGHHAFLLSDLPEFHPNWVLQFLVAARRADHVVGVFEHSVGGHEFESGALALLQSVDLWLLQREYETEAAEREQYDGMMADFFELVERRETLRRWRDDSELVALAATEIPGEDC